jgi:hypothetical protein
MISATYEFRKTKIAFPLLNLSEGIPELDEAIENALKPFGFINTGKNLELGLRDLLFEADGFEMPENR